MSEPLTQAELDELRALEGEATPGPWTRIHGESRYELYGAGLVNRFVAKMSLDDGIAWADGALILAARNALPRLLGELERLRTLASLVTIRQVIAAGHEAIDAAGLNPWCINEGLATGDERILP